MNFDELKSMISRAGSIEVGVGASEAEVKAAEVALALVIRGDYRRFLLEYGWGGVGHMELYGVGKDVPRHLNLVEITKSERGEMIPPLHSDLLPLCNDGAGNLYCLDTTSDGPRVVFWNHEASAGQIPQVESGDFSSWLASMIAGAD